MSEVKSGLRRKESNENSYKNTKRISEAIKQQEVKKC